MLKMRGLRKRQYKAFGSRSWPSKSKLLEVVHVLVATSGFSQPSRIKNGSYWESRHPASHDDIVSAIDIHGISRRAVHCDCRQLLEVEWGGRQLVSFA